MNTRNQSARWAFMECLMTPGHLVLWTSASARAGVDVFELLRLTAAQPIFAPYITRVARSSGRQCIEFANGSRIVFVCRGRGGGRGFSGVNVLVYDEADRLTDEQHAELAPTQMAAAHPETRRIFR